MVCEGKGWKWVIGVEGAKPLTGLPLWVGLVLACLKGKRVGELHSLIEDELIHWYKNDKGESCRSSLRLESEEPQLNNGFPRDGLTTLRLVNGIGSIGFKLNPDEALRLSTLLLTIAKEQINKKRSLWQHFED